MVEYDEIQSAKKDAAKSYAEQLDGVRQKMRRLADQIRSRTERRMVSCQIDYHVPQVGFKRITRTDAGELVREAPMTDEERQQRMFEEEAAADADRAPERTAKKKKCAGKEAGAGSEGEE